MESKFIIVLLLIGVAASQSSSQERSTGVGNSPHVVQSIPQHVSNQPQSHVGSSSLEPNNNGGKSQESPTYIPYAYRSSSSPGQGLQTQSNNGYQNYAPTAFTRETYGTSRDSSGQQVVGVSSSADFYLSAYFGQIFWAFVACSLTLVVSIYVIRYFVGTEGVSGLVDKLQNSGATGKSMDLDRLTNMVYQAFDTYGKWAAKEEKDFGATLKGR